MPVVTRRLDAGSSRNIRTADLSVALINNMPDGAFNSTERQFVDLIERGSGPLSVEVKRYSLRGIPRERRIAQRIASDYLPISALDESKPDAVIVTGSEPLAPVLHAEPYWDELVRVLEGLVGRVPSLLLSCLSAHVALELFDGLNRIALPAKCSGVFAQQVSANSRLTAGLGEPLVLPHSRLNDVPEEAVRGAGYEVLLRSEAFGWSVVTKELGSSELVLVQGHPEYHPSSLLREYRRDLERYLGGVRDTPPCLPSDCVSPMDRPGLTGLHRRILGGGKDPNLMTTFPFEDVARRADWPWRDLAVRLYTNWLAEVYKRSV